MVAYNDENLGAYVRFAREPSKSTCVATGTSGLTLENLVSMDPKADHLCVTSDRNKIGC